MKVITKTAVAQKYIAKLKKCGKTVGLVPTMGALHKGHISLIKRARQENDIVVVTIFVNPLQFGKNEDFKRYPRNFKEDKKVCRQNGVDIVFYPSISEMYKERHLTFVEVHGISDILCGKYRPGHFRGVATVVLKLFNIVQPDRAYFGQKDFQQLKIIEKMVKDLNIPVKIIACRTVRERSGLALSSRNQYLSEKQQRSAAGLYRVLSMAKNDAKNGKIRSPSILKSKIIKGLKKIDELKVEYVEVVDEKTLRPVGDLKGKFRIMAAVWFGKTRLIDNV